METASAFPGIKRLGCEIDHLVAWLRMRGTIPPHPDVFPSFAQRQVQIFFKKRALRLHHKNFNLNLSKFNKLLKRGMARKRAKGKFYPKTGREGPEKEIDRENKGISLLFL
jgi:hypothetical protein